MSRNQMITGGWRSPRIQVLAGALIISFSSIFVKLAHVGPTTAGYYRMLFGSLALLAVVLIRHHRLWTGWRSFSAAGVAGLMFFLGLVFWHHSIHFVGPGLATIFSNFQVFVVAFGAVIFMGERPGRRLALAIPLAVTGLFLIVAPEWSQVGPDYRRGIYLGHAVFRAADIDHRGRRGDYGSWGNLYGLHQPGAASAENLNGSII